MKRVYCSKCKYLKMDAIDPECTYPGASSWSVDRDWYTETQTETFGDPRLINENNDCQYYEEKNES